MKTCPVCGLTLEESYLFCPEDGSALPTAVAAEPEIEDKIAQPVAPEKPSSVVLYCPACAAEYPLTFSLCPVHGVPLTTHKIPAVASTPRKAAKAETAAKTETATKIEPAPKAETSLVSQPPPTSYEAYETVADQRQPEEVAEEVATASQSSSPLLAEKQPAEFDYAPARPRFRFRRAARSTSLSLIGSGVERSTIEPDIEEFDDSTDGSKPDRPSEVLRENQSYRNAAYVVVACLILFGLLGAVSLYKSLSRRPVAALPKMAAQSSPAEQQAVAIPTPQAALDYKEEKPEAEKTVAETQQAEEQPTNIRADKSKVPDQDSTPQPRRIETLEQRPVAATRQQSPAPLPVQAPVARTAPAAELVLPRGTFGQVDARLVNVRSRKTMSGMRYDLTFNMQEQAGRATQLERIAVMTRSASGISRSQTMPFYHRLGAAGTLTFTVSVEMQGRAQPDWQGRIICTSIGTDQTGRAFRASFGANVNPN
jgi:hypothetical protein